VIVNLFASDATALSELLGMILPGIVAPFQVLAVTGMIPTLSSLLTLQESSATLLAGLA
jgi:hypothetical protein